jgi:predicted transport protein
LLRRIENHKRKEWVKIDEYTIEHILPQNINLSEQWKEMLGPEWERIQETWLHTLGNLTLTGYNSEYSDRPFNEKRDMEGGFKGSPIKLNQGLGQIINWDENAIKDRANRLSQMATEVWEIPQIEDEILDSYRPSTQTKTEYTIDDHPYLSTGSPIYGDKTRQLFEAFRKEVLAIDPVVVEEFLKFYVAYKAETNFVDVVPRAKRLRLTFNMPFSEIVDDRGICKDVTGLGRWGNGDVSVNFTEIDELPYIMGLVRQSFERQMDNGG